MKIINKNFGKYIPLCIYAEDRILEPERKTDKTKNAQIKLPFKTANLNDSFICVLRRILMDEPDRFHR